MIKIKNILLLVISSFALTSCGLGLKEYYKGDAYVSGDFDKDYYRVWNEKIDVNSSKSKVIKTNIIELNDDRDYVFRSYKDPNFRLVDRDAYDKELTYEDDYYPNNGDYYLNKGYGPTRKLSRVDNSFKYGYLSKLFDGQMFCHQRFQYARVQIDEKGFGSLFKKEADLSDTYFAVNFKASYDYTKSQVCNFAPYGTDNAKNLETDIKIEIGLYVKVDQGYVKNVLTYSLNDVPTNASESTSKYTFFGFRTTKLGIDLTRVAGVSIGYQFDRDSLDANPLKNLKDNEGNPYQLAHSLMVYEMFMPRTIWR